MLNAMLHINQINAGIVQPLLEFVPTQDIPVRLGHRVFHPAATQGLELRGILQLTQNTEVSGYPAAEKVPMAR